MNELVLAKGAFAALALVTVLGAAATVFAKNPIRGAMGLLLCIAGIAGLFLGLHAQFLAAIQLIVYAGAVVILFVFVIMLLGPDATSPKDAKAAFSRVGAAVLFASGVAWAGLRLAASSDFHPEVRGFDAARAEMGSLGAVGREIYTRGLVPFELVSVLFIVAVVGAVAVARGKQRAAGSEDAP